MQAHDILGNLQSLPELEFRTLSTFNGGVVGVYWAESGTSPWEQHPDDDELLQVVEGSVDIEVLDEDDSAVIHLSQGSIFVVPRGHWHRHRVSGVVKELYVTPGRTETSHAADPRRPEGPERSDPSQ